MLFDAIIYSGLVPLAIAAMVAFVMRRSYAPAQAVWPIAISAGFLVAQFALGADEGIAASLRTFIEPHQAIDWLPHITLLALGISILMYLSPSHRGWLYVLAGALCLAVPVRLLSGNVASQWSLTVKFGWLAVLTGVLGTTWRLLATDNEEDSTPFRVPMLAFVAVGIAVVIIQSGVFIYGMSAAALGAAICGVAIAFGLRKSGCNPGAAASAGVITLVLGSLIILTHFFAELSLLNAVLLLLALIATAIPLPAFLRTAAAWRLGAARAVLCIVPTVISVVSVVH
jgi:hypothetical protein